MEVNNYMQCNRCLMDSTASDIVFNEDGTCNYCVDYLTLMQSINNVDEKERGEGLYKLIELVKSNGKGKKYDCIIGVSGGVDSSWVLVKSVELGLRPLAVHMDNGWNSELAQNNISNLVKDLNVDLYTYVIDWIEYRDLQKAFFKANVIDIELLYDNALMGVNYKQARKYGLKYILSGSNTATEGVRMPPNWAKNNKLDYLNIKRIWKKSDSSYRLKSFPGYGFNDYFIDSIIKRKLWVKFLDYIDYDKNEAVSTLSSQYGYTPYPYKHYESIFTRFYQGYILPKKFNVDKRKNHLSALVLSKKITREDALKDLQSIPYNNIKDLNEDISYFLKKFNWSQNELSDYLTQTRVEHYVYGSENYKFNWFFRMASALKTLIFKNK